MTPKLADEAARSKTVRPMDLALEQAMRARDLGEVPVGAVVVSADGEVLACAGNRTLAMRDPTAHAELLAIRAACAKLGSERLSDCDLYVTLEPCAMCAAAISFARIRRLYFGAADAKGGAVEHGPRFFAQRPAIMRRKWSAVWAKPKPPRCSSNFSRRAAEAHGRHQSARFGPQPGRGPGVTAGRPLDILGILAPLDRLVLDIARGVGHEAEIEAVPAGAAWIVVDRDRSACDRGGRCGLA